MLQQVVMKYAIATVKFQRIILIMYKKDTVRIAFVVKTKIMFLSHIFRIFWR